MTATPRRSPAGPDEPAVRVEGLGRRFGEIVAVEGLRFSVRRGELFGLVGPDGAGKTTTLRMLAGVLPPTTGRATVFGVDVATDPEGAKPDLAYMPQRFGLYADLTVRENLDFYADLYEVPPAERPARLERLYRFSGLAPFEGRLAGNLSGGMKQKLGLSCALVHRPRLLLLDEPTFGVDPISRRDLWLIVHEMVARGVTVIASTAYMDEAERFDRLALLHGGRALAVETPDALRAPLEGRLLAVRAGVRPPPDDEAGGDAAQDSAPQDEAPDSAPAISVRLLRDRLAALPFVSRAVVFGDRIHLTVGSAEAARPRVEAELRRAGLDDVAVTAREPSMEDVFMERLADAERDREGTGAAG